MIHHFFTCRSGVCLLHVPQAVLRELDGLKHNPLLGKAARDASRLLERAQVMFTTLHILLCRCLP